MRPNKMYLKLLTIATGAVLVLITHPHNNTLIVLI